MNLSRGQAVARLLLYVDFRPVFGRRNLKKGIQCNLEALGHSKRAPRQRRVAEHICSHYLMELCAKFLQLPLSCNGKNSV